MTATVIPIRSVATWDALRDEYSKLEQMGWQSVLQAMRVGDMLIELRGDMTIREFVPRAAQHVNGMTHATAQRLMTLARNRQLLENLKPESQRKALTLIAAQTPKVKEEKPYRESWPDALLRNAVIDPVLLKGGSEVGVRRKIQKAGIALPDTGYFSNTDDADNFALAYARAFPQEEQHKHTLTKSDQKKVDRAVAIEKERLQGLFMQELYAEVSRRTPEITAERLKEIEENREETRRYRILNATTRKLITTEEYRILLSIVHPDHAPNGLTEKEKEKYAKGFIIIKKLKDYAEA